METAEGRNEAKVLLPVDLARLCSDQHAQLYNKQLRKIKICHSSLQSDLALKKSPPPVCQN